MSQFIKNILLKSYLVIFCVFVLFTCKDDEDPNKGTCKDGIKNQDEVRVDCGGVCSSCPPTCADGIKNQGETKKDCGGPCKKCPKKKPSCKDGVRNQDETGIDCGGKCKACDPKATCEDKKKNQSETGVDCGGPCPACPSCKDGKKNQGETGTDCGGPCPPCAKDANCNDGKKNQNETGIDCGGKCPACPSCKDGKKNQDEKKVDCGGSKCPPCPTCRDKIKNQGEKGVDCGGPCPNKCATCTDGKKNQGEKGIDCGGPCAPCGGTAARRKAINDYYDNYVGSHVAKTGWTGNVAKCKAGTVSKSTKDKVLQRINYFRRMVGLNDNITWDVSRFKMYQEAALIQFANGRLTHYPTSSWKCYSKLGYDGSSTANLSYRSASDAVTDFIYDPGGNNYYVGHRRWIFNSIATKFSFGTCNKFMALGVVGRWTYSPRNTKIPKYIAYPPNGYIPRSLVFPRWSLGIPGADFSRAKVKMTGPNNKNIPLKINPYRRGVADNTLVWEPKKGSVNLRSLKDVKYTVTVSDVYVRGVKKPPYVYSVVIIKP